MYAELLESDKSTNKNVEGSMLHWKRVLERKYKRKTSPLNSSLDFTKVVTKTMFGLGAAAINFDYFFLGDHQNDFKTPFLKNFVYWLKLRRA